MKAFDRETHTTRPIGWMFLRSTGLARPSPEAFVLFCLINCCYSGFTFVFRCRSNVTVGAQLR